MPIKPQKGKKKPQAKGKGNPNQKPAQKKQPQQNQQKKQNNNDKNNKNNEDVDNKNDLNNNNDQQNEEKVDDSLKIHGINLIPKEDYIKSGQTYPPTKIVSSLFDANNYPTGQITPHPYDVDGKIRLESEEKKAIEKHIQWETRLSNVREAAEVHRQVRQATQHYIKPGMTMIQICNFIESNSSKLVGFNRDKPMERGWGFPTGCSINNCAAHYTPNPGDDRILKKTDLCKIDFGVQINGDIIDCAFSMSFDEMHDNLMEAVKAATNEGVKVMGIDARLGEVGAAIQEVMESYECRYDNKDYPVKAIRNLNGHSIGRWIIHGGKSVPIVKTNDQTKMEEGELFAIETFGSTGKGQVHDEGECSHFGLIPNQSNLNIEHKGARDLYKYISKRFGTIPFCRRWLEDDDQKRHLLALKHLVDSEIVRAYPPLCDTLNCYTAQYEHTILLRPTCKEVLSRGLDF